MLLIAITDKGYLPLGEAFSLDEAIELLPGYLRAASEAGHQVARIEAWHNRLGAFRLAIADTEEINKRAGLGAADSGPKFKVGDKIKWTSCRGDESIIGIVCPAHRIISTFKDLKPVWAMWENGTGLPGWAPEEECTLISPAEANHEA